MVAPVLLVYGDGDYVSSENDITFCASHKAYPFEASLGGMETFSYALSDIKIVDILLKIILNELKVYMAIHRDTEFRSNQC